jgi:signal transduction histidine kinase
VFLVRAELHDRPSPPWHLIAGVVLTALLVTLAVLQYRWLDEVGEAERARMRAGLQSRAADFTQEFDLELTRIYVAFHGDPDTIDLDPAAAIAAQLARAQASASAPGLIKDVFLLESQGPRPGTLQRFDPASRTLQPAEWPAALESWRLRATHVVPLGANAGVLPVFLADAVDAAAPALIIPMPFVKRIGFESAGANGRFAVVPDNVGTARAIIVCLDADRVRRQLLEPLVAKYFGAGDASEYIASIVQRDAPSRVVYTSAADATVDQKSADVTAGMFDLRLNEVTRLTRDVKTGPEQAGKPPADQVAVTIVRRSATPGDAAKVLMTGGANQGAWQVRARYRSGSLESIVARSRRRNLAIGLGVLGLLGAAFALVMAAAQRQRRLAQQQMEFVAAVSHELRTPLAVICSAGENLADGVVADSAQVKTYGSLIETEGRRLGDMVERVLLFAGIGSGVKKSARAEVDVAQVIADAVSGVGAEARDRDVHVTVHTNGALPPVMGDADALRSAVQNIVGNAVKYSLDGGAVDVTAEVVDGAIVRIRVADRGLGIDAADLPHIFKPFYRGRRAVDAQVRGTGIGLSVVLHVIQSHGGDVHLDSRAGEGTTVTVMLPAAAPAAADGHARMRIVRLKGERASEGSS